MRRVPAVAIAIIVLVVLPCLASEPGQARSLTLEDRAAAKRVRGEDRSRDDLDLLVGTPEGAAPNGDATLWIQMASSGPSPRRAHALAYDSARGVTVLYGGFSDAIPEDPFLGDTWEWNGATWTQRPVGGPGGRSLHVMAYDSARHRVVLFGGETRYGWGVNETWEWGGTTWTLQSVLGPGFRTGHAMAYDSVRECIVLFGGTNGSTRLSDTWEWDGATWTQRAIAGPAPRSRTAMAYDSARGRLVLFGGYGDSGPLGDTWEWDGTVWTQRSTSGPSAGGGHAMAYDDARGVTVLYGGYVGSYLGDTWEWDGTTWNKRPIAGPAPRDPFEVAYDLVRGRLVLFGGWDGSSNLGDTWEYSRCSPSYRDLDGDGFGTPEDSSILCPAPPGYVANATDCNDSNAHAYPGAPEICDGADNQCPGDSGSGSIDEGFELGVPCAAGTGACARSGVTVCTADGAGTVCDATPGAPATFYRDQDEDGYGDPATTIVQCSAPAGYVSAGGDCNDADPQAHPGITETCDGTDSNCNGMLDDGCDGFCDSPGPVAPDTVVLLQYSQKAHWSAVWTGTDLGIAYLDNYFGSWDVWFARVDGSGHLVANSRVTTEYYGFESYPTIAWTGSEFGIAWRDERNSTPYNNQEIYFTRVDANGARLAPDIRVTDSQGDSTFPTIVWNGTEYGLAWEDNREGGAKVYFVALDQQGAKRFPERAVTDRVIEGQLRLLWNGTHYALAWWDWYPDSDYEIYFGRLDRDGIRIGNFVRVTNSPGESGGPFLVWNGSGYGIAWYDERVSPANQEIFLLDLGQTEPSSGKISESPTLRPTNTRPFSCGREASTLWLGVTRGTPRSTPIIPTCT